MRTALILMMGLFVQPLVAQVYLLPPPIETAQRNIRYIIIYQNIEQRSRSSGGSLVMVQEMVTKISGFETLNGMLTWLNDNGWGGKPQARIDEDQFIAAYDLDDAKKIDLKFVKEEKILPKRVEIQEEKWTETKWKVKE